jgi:hypothetical protein
MVPGLEDVMPVLPARDLMPKWLDIARADFASRMAGGYPTDRVESVHRCPGIVSLLSQGWIVRAWQDIVIETNGDGETFGWKVNVDLADFKRAKDIGHTYSQFVPKRPGTLSTTIKFQSPWMARVPEGWRLLFVPMLYSDDVRFTSVPGVLDTNIDSSIIIQMHWHVLNGTEVVRAGTPLAHLVAVPAEQTLDMEISPWNPEVAAEEFKDYYKIFNQNLTNYSKF